MVGSRVTFAGVAREGYPAPMRIITLPGVFSPRSDTWMLADVMRRVQPLRDADVLELGTGSGAIGVAAAQSGARSVTVVDVSRRALMTAAINARLNGVRVTPRRGDLFAAVAGRQFDLVVSNPPYLPSDAIPNRGAARAWEGGGADGRALLERICADVAAHLRPGGTVLLVHSSVNDVSRTLAALEQAGLQADIVHQQTGPLGPLLSAKRPDLDEEDIYVVRGRRL